MNDKPDIWFAGGVHWYLHPRFVDVQRPAAYGLYWAMVAWSRDNLTDGRVPAAVVTSILAPAVKADGVKDPKELVRVGLLGERDGVYEIHNYGAWNDSAEKASRRKSAARNAARLRWGSEAQSEPHANGIDAAVNPLRDPHTKPKTETKPKPEAKT